MHLLFRFLRNDSGATAIEYGLIAGMIGAALIGSLQTIGANLSAKFMAIANAP